MTMDATRGSSCRVRSAFLLRLCSSCGMGLCAHDASCYSERRQLLQRTTPVATANEGGRRLLTFSEKNGANGPAGFGRPVLGASSSPVAAEPQTSQIKAGGSGRFNNHMSP